MSLILCLSPAYQPFVRSCRERRVCPSFCVSHRCTSPLCGLVGRDVCLPHFVSLTGVPASIFHPSSMNYNMSIIISIFMQERSPYIITLKMNGSELLFVYNNVEIVAEFVVYSCYITMKMKNVHIHLYYHIRRST